MNAIQPTALYHQRGTGMVEVLVAAFIIGFGLLGIAGLQVTALQASSGAEIRATAMDLAMTTADRIRANLIADNCYCRNTPTCTAVPPCATAGTGVAATDLTALDAIANSRLPGGTLTITCSDKDAAVATPDGDACTAGSIMTITVIWQTQRDQVTAGVFTDQIAMPFIPGRQEGL